MPKYAAGPRRSTEPSPPAQSFGSAHSQNRSFGLGMAEPTHQPNDLLQAQLRQTDAEVVERAAAAERLRKSLAQHRGAHGSVLREIDARLQQIDRDVMYGERPHLRTAARTS